MNRWTILNETRRSRQGVYVMARCECGTEREVLRSNILRNHSRSCGCYQREISRKNATRHGRSHTPMYWAWSEMIGRCTNPNNPKWYFVADMGERPPGMSLDRIDNNGPYSPENCRWATGAEQHSNRTHCPTCQCLSEGVQP